MKIKNNTVSNQSVYAKSTRGKAAKKYLTVVAGSTLTLDDQEWLNEYEGSAAALIKAGRLEVVEAPKKTEEQIAKEEAAKLAEARKLVAAADKKAS